MNTLEQRAHDFANEMVHKCLKEGKNVSIGITIKQANVVFACNKQGKIHVSKEVISAVYDLADVYYKKSFYNQAGTYVDKIVTAVQAIFNNEYEIAQYLLESAVED